MSYQVVYPKNWERRLRRLPPHVVRRIRRDTAALADEPRPRGYRELRPKGRGFRIRVLRDWRITYDIDETARVVEIAEVFVRGRVPY